MVKMFVYTFVYAQTLHGFKLLHYLILTTINSQKESIIWWKASLLKFEDKVNK